MRCKFFNIFSLVLTTTILCNSCSTTRVLSDGQYRLTKNLVETGGNKELNTNDISSYINQKPSSWNPRLCVYNWSGKKGHTLLGKFFRKMGVAPVVYDPESLALSVENIEKHLDYLGYYGSVVNTETLYHNKKVKVKYSIEPGRRYSIRDISFNLPDRGEIAKDFLADTLNLSIHRGDYLSEALLEKETERSSAHLRGVGYYGFTKNYYSFEADTLKYPGEALLEMTVKEYSRNETINEAQVIQKYHFGDVQLSYPSNFRIKEKVLRNLNTIHPREIYSEDAVNRTYNRLSSLRSLSSVTVSLTKADSAYVDCDIALTPATPQGFKINLEGSINSTGLFGISPELSWFHRNIFHGGEMMNLSFMGNFQFKPNKDVSSTELAVSGSVSLPKFLGLPDKLFKAQIPRTDLKLSYNYQNRPEYRRNIISASYGYSGYSGLLNYQFVPVQLNIVRLFNIEPSFYEKISKNPFLLNSYQDHFDLGMGTTLYYTTNSDVTPKTTYHYYRFQFGLAGNILSAFKGLMKKDENGSGMIWNTPFSQYVRAEFTVGKTWTFGKKDHCALATRFLAGAGYAYGNSSVLPFEQHFFAGGANSLRGWQSRNVGPGLAQAESSFVIPNQSGDMKLEANAEFRFPLFWKLNGATFIDAGNVWTLQESKTMDRGSLGKLKAGTFLKSIAADFGIGVRVDLSFILLRIDMGMQVHDPSQGEGERWLAPDQWLKKGNYAFHFGVGYPF